MKIMRVDQLTGNEVLAKDIVSKDYAYLLARGNVLRKEYIQKLKEMHISMVYVEEQGRSIESVRLLKSEVEEKFVAKVKEILETHTYQKSEELSRLCETAESIIEEVIEDENVAERVFDIRERSADLYEHSISVCSLATLTALKMHIDKETIRAIGIGALLHDLGLRYMSIDYVNKDMADMPVEEMTEYKKHSIYGYSSVENESWMPKIAKDIILYHHENIDGSGFPLKTGIIPFESEIVSVCEAFDERICGVGAKRVKVYEAVEYFATFKGEKYDETIVRNLLEFIAVYPAGTRVKTNTNEVGVVIKQNAEFPNRPYILLIEDGNGNKYDERIIKNLIQDQTMFIESVLD